MTRRRKLLLGVAALLGLTIVIPILHHYQLKAAVDCYRGELKAKGEPMELAQVLPPPVPPNGNGAELFLKAAALLGTNQTLLDTSRPPCMRMVAPGKAMVGWAQAEVRAPGKNGSTNSWGEIKAAVAHDGAAIS